MGKRILLNNRINKDDVQYEWVAEKTACEVCQSMNGVIYDSANDIPDRPHPNCKCHIEIIEKESDETVTDPLEDYSKKRRDKEQTLLEIKEIYGKTSSLMEELDEYCNQVSEQERKIQEFESIFDINKFEEKDRLEFLKAKEDIDFKKFRGEKVKGELVKLQSEVNILEGGVEETNILSYIIGAFKIAILVFLTTLDIIARTVIELTTALIKVIPHLQKNIFVRLYIKYAADKYGEHHAAKYNMPESLDLYKVGSESYDYNNEYVKKNGTMYESINDLHDYKLEKDIRSRIAMEKDMDIKDCRVLKLRSDSSIAEKIKGSYAMKQFILDNIAELTQNGSVSQVKDITFNNDDWDMYSALHSAAAKNVYMDKAGNIHASIEDFWNFNPDRFSVKGMAGKFFQDVGKLSPYYIKIDVIVPKEVWQRYIIL